MADDDRARVARIVAQIGDEADRAWLVDRLAEPWQRRARRLAERDARIRDYALAYHPLLSGHAMAAAIAVAIDRYGASGWKRERDLPAPADPRRGLLWRILHLNGGRGLSAERVRFVLAGCVVVSANKSRKQATATATHRRLGLKSGTNRNVGRDQAGHERKRR
jgi:hypothetical protein